MLIIILFVLFVFTVPLVLLIINSTSTNENAINNVEYQADIVTIGELVTENTTCTAPFGASCVPNFVATINSQGQTQDTFLVTGNNDVLVNDNQISLASALVVDSLTTSNTMTFGTDTSCINPLHQNCFDLSSATCPVGSPLLASCLNQQELTFDSLNIVNLTLVNNSESTFMDFSTVQAADVFVHSTTTTGSIICNNGMSGISSECLDLGGVTCSTPLDASCIPNDLPFTGVTVSDTLTLNGQVNCNDGTIDQNCFDVSGLKILRSPSTVISNNARILDFTGSAATITTDTMLNRINIEYQFNDVNQFRIFQLNRLFPAGSPPSGPNTYINWSQGTPQFFESLDGNVWDGTTRMLADDWIANYDRNYYITAQITVQGAARIEIIKNGVDSISVAVTDRASTLDLNTYALLRGGEYVEVKLVYGTVDPNYACQFFGYVR